MTDNDWRNAMIEEAASAIHAVAESGASWFDARMADKAQHRAEARAALSVFEKALGEATVTPTDDEREVGVETLPSGTNNVWDGIEWHNDVSDALASVIRRGLAAGFRRSEVPEPSAEDVSAYLRGDEAHFSKRAEPQGEPSDAQYPEIDAFAERMRAEMIANAGKGDRWREMTLWQAWCEISWHVGKMTAAIKAEDIDLIRELAADVANGALMLDEIALALRAAGGVQ